jgi:signal transduction histidine kinase
MVSTRASSNGVAITISDNGGGIDQSDLPRVFDPFFTTKRGGTGLGLPIAKNIVEGLGGTITVTSVPGRGTDVRIDLPFDSPASEPLAQGKPGDTPPAPSSLTGERLAQGGPA